MAGSVERIVPSWQRGKILMTSLIKIDKGVRIIIRNQRNYRVQNREYRVLQSIWKLLHQGYDYMLVGGICLVHGVV